MYQIISLAIVFTSGVFIVKLFLDHHIQKKLIDKGLLDENVKFLYPKRSDYQASSSLKWGLVLIGVGAAFIVGQLVPRMKYEEVTIGCMFVFPGIALLAYYFIAGHLVKKMKEKDK